MKLSKSLLQAIAVGVVVGAAASSCETIKNDIENMHDKTCGENCIIDHSKIENETFDCPACGMG